MSPGLADCAHDEQAARHQRGRCDQPLLGRWQPGPRRRAGRVPGQGSSRALPGRHRHYGEELPPPGLAVIRADILDVPTDESWSSRSQGPRPPGPAGRRAALHAVHQVGFWLDWKRAGLDPDASLLQAYTRVLREARPRRFILENVYALTYNNQASQAAFERLLREIDDAGYDYRARCSTPPTTACPSLGPACSSSAPRGAADCPTTPSRPMRLLGAPHHRRPTARTSRPAKPWRPGGRTGTARSHERPVRPPPAGNPTRR